MFNFILTFVSVSTLPMLIELLLPFIFPFKHMFLLILTVLLVPFVFSGLNKSFNLMCVSMGNRLGCYQSGCEGGAEAIFARIQEFGLESK